MDDEWPIYEDEDVIIFPESIGFKAIVRPSGVFSLPKDVPRFTRDDDQKQRPPE